MIGVPIPVIIILWLLTGHLWTSGDRPLWHNQRNGRAQLGHRRRPQ